jgi:CBS domain-containing protein
MTRIADIMTRDVQVVRASDTVQRAARCMKDLDVGAVPVCDGRRLIGMITDRDIALRVCAEGLSPATTHVGDVMSRELRWCTGDDSAVDILAGMGDHQVRRLPVLDADRQLVGIVSLGDFATRQGAQVEHALREISAPD